MSCTSSDENDIYDFFNNVSMYIIEEMKNVSPIPSNSLPRDCDNFSKQHNKLGNKEKVKDLCISFVILNKLLKSIQTDDHNHCNFLNYWLNSELSKNWFSENNIMSDVFLGIESQIFNNNEYKLLECTFCNINKDELNKMKILYSLYENYSKLNAIEYTNSEQNTQVLTLSTACCTDYIKVSYICNGDNKKNNAEFCEKLEGFELKYNELFKKFDGPSSEFSHNLIKLEECPNPKIITTAVTGSIVGLIPLLGVLYKFTPMGHMFRSKIGILNNNISNNEEMTKISLIEQENEPIKFQQGTYNIKYQSL
ncbi:Plasmodium vivax Vir protein, putative [Plasmodium vivax]|uniref:Vir protein, putative n=1 Tax=Plasmodium vivax TaxID=5855 RepID=A0A1G4EC72_PLAVI|nr:Plasmodium vivax Vir protein, putative [Plasmodium vivax]